jgi:hypothetical protein
MAEEVEVVINNPLLSLQLPRNPKLLLLQHGLLLLRRLGPRHLLKLHLHRLGPLKLLNHHLIHLVLLLPHPPPTLPPSPTPRRTLPLLQAQWTRS